MTVTNMRRRLSGGLELRGRDADARAWAPACRTVDVVIDASAAHGRRIVELTPEGDGVFGGVISDIAAGDRYWLRLDGERLRPDPVSRYQPEGPHGPSEVVDPDRFQWSDASWPGIGAERHVIYEMHVGTYTPEGTWRAAAAQLDELARLGITVVEMMPVAEFPGQWGWGYDGVNLYAPTRLYGTPDDLRAFVDRAHALGIGVILDVVYNHFGPDGNYLQEFSPDFFTKKYKNDWGLAINFEGPAQVREFFIENAAYWIREFHFDGLRLDATQDVHDASPRHVLADITERARAAAGDRRIYLVAENEPQNARLVRSPEDGGGYGLDALWNDDFHHTAFVALTGRREAYFTDYTGTPQEFVSCAKYGFLYQGQWYSWQTQRRGTASLDLPRSATVTFLENHDQVANTGFGHRLRHVSSPPRFRALTAVLLLGPSTPLLFQGQEFGSSAPFQFFVDHEERLQEPIRNGRREFLRQFASLKDQSMDHVLPSPTEEETFHQCRLDLRERETHAEVYALHRDLIALRRTDPVLANIQRARVDGAVLGPAAFVLRYFGGTAGDRLLVVNLGCDVQLTPAPEPLLAAPQQCRWVQQWRSEAPEYGGQGTPAIDTDAVWSIPGETALLFRSEPRPADGERGESCRRRT